MSQSMSKTIAGSEVPLILNSINVVMAALKSFIANHVTFARLKMGIIRKETVGSLTHLVSLTNYTARLPTV